MYIPIVHERVRVKGRRGIHVVVFADYRHAVADIRPEVDLEAVEKGVAFELLLAEWENAPQEIVNQSASSLENHA
jgi:hypothetical protein